MITYETGNPHFGGRTFIQLANNGDVLVEQKQGDQTRRFSGKVNPAVHRGILMHFKEAHRSAVGLSEDKPVPGETLVTLHAVTAVENIDLSFWSNQRWSQPALDRLISDFERLASTASGGVVRF